MLSSLLDLLTQNNELQKAKDLFLRLTTDHAEFVIDEYKVIDLATLMCRKGQVNDGVKLLQRHAESTKVRSGPMFERNLVNLLLAAHQGCQLREERGEGNAWTPATLMNELIRLGYVMQPAPASMKTKLKDICGCQQQATAVGEGEKARNRTMKRKS
ncbi:uncharacterized protein [Hetaerina americana]